MNEAKLAHTAYGLVPEGEGWFVLNARDARWGESGELGRYTPFEGEGDARFPELGINVSVLQPGQPSCMYHREDAQEDFLVLAGEAILVIEGEERRLAAWDFVHCPAWTEHVIVGAGEGPCIHHFAIEVDDIEKYTAELKKQGCEIISKPGSCR